MDRGNTGAFKGRNAGFWRVEKHAHHQFPQHVQYSSSLLRFCEMGIGGFSLGRFELFPSFSAITFSIRSSKMSVTFSAVFAEVSANGIPYLLAESLSSYPKLGPNWWRRPCASPYPVCYLPACIPLSGWCSCSSPRTTCGYCRRSPCRWGHRQWGCHQLRGSNRWWWCGNVPAQRCPTTQYDSQYQHNLDPLVSLVDILDFLHRGTGYEIDADGVEHVLRELVFLHEWACTANRMSKLDFPTPLLPISSTFMLRSLPNMHCTSRFPLAFLWIPRWL